MIFIHNYNNNISEELKALVFKYLPKKDIRCSVYNQPIDEIERDIRASELYLYIECNYNGQDLISISIPHRPSEDELKVYEKINTPKSIGTDKFYNPRGNNYFVDCKITTIESLPVMANTIVKWLQL